MKTILLLIAIIYSLNSVAQTDSLKALNDIHAFQKRLDDEYRNPKESPLEPKERKKFKGHTYFQIDLNYRVVAKLTVTEGTPFLQMKTTTTRFSTDRIFGYVEFTLKGKDFRVPVYQSKDLMKQAEYVDYLFFPFTDETNDKQTYGGGRYIDLRIPTGQELVIDFNQAYNPLCAYNHIYSCPIVPTENQLDIEVPVGVMYDASKK